MLIDSFAGGRLYAVNALIIPEGNRCDVSAVLAVPVVSAVPLKKANLYIHLRFFRVNDG